MRNRNLKNEINVVPYIDVMLVLLVIFMVTAPMMTTSVIDIPSVGSNKNIKTEPNYVVNLNIDADKNISFVNKHTKVEIKNISKDDLIAKIKELNSSIPDEECKEKCQPIVIYGDKNIVYSKIVDTMVLLKEAGIQNKISLAITKQSK